MKIASPIHHQTILRAITERTRWKSSFIADLSVFAGILAILYALFVSGRIWFAPFTPVAHISSSPRVLPLYAAYSLVRIAIAYVLSLLFALAYGFAAAKSERAARLILPFLAILPSIPVLSFLPASSLLAGTALVVGMALVLVFITGQPCIVVFLFPPSQNAIPRSLDEAAPLSRYVVWGCFVVGELPFGAMGLV